MKFILASSNKHKLEELKLLMPDVEILEANMVEVDENASTFVENALIKAEALYKENNGTPILADDSGLCIKAFDGKPGVKTARYGSKEFGRILESSERNEYLLKNMAGIKDRSASFVCSLVAYFSPNQFYTVTEEVKGHITEKQTKGGGFGYDPVFYIDEVGATAAELTQSEKGKYSHRGKAARTMNKLLKNMKEEI
ncbi:MAG: RdgB/HAM1 family non-canonical purine NTP pyrophosphatase [Spirochaetaceae bacterium]|nr:RdgB/HAM1 family non-canonical purine NTP pyrophosphatase [Spirochaetaceae bacterium]